jgi:hypothetical protein
MPMDDGEVRWISEGLPDMQVAIARAMTSRSPTAGMCRGSRELAPMTTTRWMFVPQYRTFRCSPVHVTVTPSVGGKKLHAITAAGHASWALGVAKSMLDDVEGLAATKFRMSDMASLASRPTFQKGLAHHVASWRAARLLVFDAFTRADQSSSAGVPRSRKSLSRCQAACRPDEAAIVG